MFHRIIRSDRGESELRGLYDLTLKTAFLYERKKCAPKEKQPDAAPRVTSEQLLEQARRKAEAILGRAGEQASAMLEETRQQAAAEAETIKSTAAKEGYEQGYRSALEEARDEADKYRAQARQVLAGAEETRRQAIEGLKEEILTLAVAIAEKVLARELETHPDAVLNVAEEAVQLAGNRKYVVLWVNPAQLEICRAHRDQMAAHLPPRAELQIMADEAVEPGGCVVENEYGRVDAKLSTRWQTMLASLREGTI